MPQVLLVTEDVHYLSHLFNDGGHQVLGLARVSEFSIFPGWRLLAVRVLLVEASEEDKTVRIFKGSTRPRDSHTGDKRNLFKALWINADLTALLDDKENNSGAQCYQLQTDNSSP